MRFPELRLYEEFVECYGELFAGIIDEVMALIDEVEVRRLTGTEAKTKVLQRARQLFYEHMPTCHEPRAAYDAREAEARRQEGEIRAKNYDEQERRRIAEAIRQKNSEELAAQRRRDAAAEEQRKAEQFREEFAKSERERLEALDREVSQ